MPETTDQVSLFTVFEGWDGYNASLIRAIAPRSPEELAFRPAPGMRSVGEIAAHIAVGRIDWFRRMGAPGSMDLIVQLTSLFGPDEMAWIGALAGDAARIVEWLEASWAMVEANLRRWTVADLAVSHRQSYRGTVYAVSRQWVIWRILSHDIQHGGQLTIMLWRQGIEIPDLGDLGGHLTEPPIVAAEPA
ncbi:MAG TPA: DinB family protein [Armatimonadota bacterium]|jgi:uncharacterized damage-inducible protein DinB